MARNGKFTRRLHPLCCHPSETVTHFDLALQFTPHTSSFHSSPLLYFPWWRLMPSTAGRCLGACFSVPDCIFAHWCLCGSRSFLCILRFFPRKRNKLIVPMIRPGTAGVGHPEVKRSRLAHGSWRVLKVWKAEGEKTNHSCSKTSNLEKVNALLVVRKGEILYFDWKYRRGVYKYRRGFCMHGKQGQIRAFVNVTEVYFRLMRAFNILCSGCLSVNGKISQRSDINAQPVIIHIPHLWKM